MLRFSVPKWLDKNRILTRLGEERVENPLLAQRLKPLLECITCDERLLAGLVSPWITFLPLELLFLRLQS